MQNESHSLTKELYDHIQQIPQHYPIKPLLRISRKKGSFDLIFKVRTSSWHFSNERTDLHDTLSILFAIFLRITNDFSSTIVDVKNEFSGIETELYARFVAIEQPEGPTYPLNEVGVDIAKRAISTLLQFQIWLLAHLELVPDSEGNLSEKADLREAEVWSQKILNVLNLPKDTRNAQYMSRTNPTWMHFRSIRPLISVILVPDISEFLHNSVKSPIWKVIHVSNRILFTSDNARNSVGSRDISLAKKILRACEINLATIEPIIIPLDNYLIAVGKSHVVTICRDCGRKKFEKDREKIKNDFAEIISAIFPTPSFKWNDSINDDEFERLILALLARESQVTWIRKVGSTNDRDAGRDLLAELITPPLHGEILTEKAQPLSPRRVVVQCKAYTRPVDKSKVKDIRDVVEHHDASGYFLVVSSSITSGLFDHLDRLRTSGKIWVDWWTRSEIEERLQKHPDILSKFSSMVQSV